MIIAFVLHCVTAFVIDYVYDTPNVYGNNKEPKIHQPKLDDLLFEEIVCISEEDSYEEIDRKNRTNLINSRWAKHKSKEYVEKVINPAYNYFRILNNIKHYQAVSDFPYFGNFILRISTVLIIAFSLYMLESVESFFLCLIISIIPCGISAWMVHLWYKHSSYTVPLFNSDLDTTENYASKTFDRLMQNNKLEFNISKDSYVNNALIEKHHAYILNIEKTAIKRGIIRNILSSFSFILFLFLIGIITPPEE